MLIDNPSAPLILIVEDDQCHAELIQRAFEDVEEEYRLLFCTTLREAREAIHNLAPRLVLTDYRLPDGNGSSLVTGDEETPVILMTSHGSEQLAVEALKAGVQDYIVKSSETFASLSRIVRRVLREWDMLREHRKAAEAIHRAKLEWEQTFDAVPDLIALIDDEHNVIRANRAMAQRLECLPEELIGRKCHEVMHETGLIPDSCPHSRALRDHQVHSRNGEQMLEGYFDISVSPLFDNEGKFKACVHVARDVTARKEAEEERLLLEQQFRQAQKLESLGVLSGGIAHDFNNILTIILGHCFLIKDDVTASAGSKVHANQIETAAQRAADLCKQMLTYAGKTKPAQSRINIRDIIEDMMKMLSSAISKSVKVELELGHDVPEIMGDSSQIQQIIMNLVINASEAIGSGTGTIRVELGRMIVTAEQEVDYQGRSIPSGVYACLRVVDNGCGMGEETRRRIFEPFYTTKFTGRGLGMSATLGIINTHKGSVQLSSTPSVGTDFRVLLPADGAAEGVRPARPAAAPAEGKGTILLVDDEKGLQTTGAAQLKSFGFSVISASDGKEALEIYGRQSSAIDLVLMDLIMPVMGGVETYRELRKLDPHLPIVICSGHGIDTFAPAVARDNRAGILLKPYTPNQLGGILSALL